jgi:S-formylglutathione hydrolase FrmB
MIARKTHTQTLFALALALLLTCLSFTSALAASPKSQLLVRELHSGAIAHNKIGIDPERHFLVYLPADYNESSPQRYPVIYFLPNPFQDNYRFDFAHNDAQNLFDRAIAADVIKNFILVTVDMTTPLGTSWNANSSVTGNWEDFMIQELVPYIDANFKTLPNRDSRGIAGIFIGGYGAIRFGMRHPDVFGSVYAMHPVGTGTGVSISMTLPKWNILANAKSMDDVKQDGRTQIFTTMFQAFLPNPDKPPLYVDLLARQDGDKLLIDAKLMDRFRNNFYLETMIPQYADNLKSLRGLKFDWNRTDGNYDHVWANQNFTRKLKSSAFRTKRKSTTSHSEIRTGASTVAFTPRFCRFFKST